MSKVENLDSKSLTAPPERQENQIGRLGTDAPGFLSGDFGLTARVSFRFNSPWRLVKSWLKTIAASLG
jgi:hypothetical protein